MLLLLGLPCFDAIINNARQADYDTLICMQ